VNWQELYSEALGRFKSRLPASGGVAVAFNTNIDGIINLNEENLASLLSIDEALSEEAFTRKDSPPGRIDDPVDFLTGLMHFIERGAGGEYMVHNEETYRWITSNLPVDEYRMGGNAGIMTNALSRLGARFVLPHVVQLPERQARLFLDRDNILLPVIGDGGLTLAHPRTAARNDRELVHLILEFKEGTSFSWGGRRITAPRNNRFIVNADDFNGRITIDPAFVEAVNRKLPEMDKFILTGLHMLKREYPDGVTHIQRLEEVKGLMQRWREMNPDLRVHLEMADIQDPLIRRDVLSMGCSVSDSVGMNEDELSAILGAEGILSRSPKELIKGMHGFVSTYGVGKLLLHSRDFVVSLISEEYGVDPSIAMDSQMVGVLASQNRAYRGDFAGIGDLEALIASDSLEPVGTDTYRSFQSLGPEEEPGIWSQRLQGRRYWVVLTPSLLSKITVNTVGLGDCLTAGSVLAEIST